jgi:hypothetical protein
VLKSSSQRLPAFYAQGVNGAQAKRQRDEDGWSDDDDDWVDGEGGLLCTPCPSTALALLRIKSSTRLASLS